jgi:hypothetical protein
MAWSRSLMSASSDRATSSLITDLLPDGIEVVHAAGHETTCAPCRPSVTPVAAPIPLDAPVARASVAASASADDEGVSLPTLLPTMASRRLISGSRIPVANSSRRLVDHVFWSRNDHSSSAPPSAGTILAASGSSDPHPSDLTGFARP